MSITQSMQKVQNYEEAFAKIQKATQITDIDELVMTFIDAEDANFSLFNYVNDLSSQIDSYQVRTLDGWFVCVWGVVCPSVGTLGVS